MQVTVLRHDFVLDVLKHNRCDSYFWFKQCVARLAKYMYSVSTVKDWYCSYQNVAIFCTVTNSTSEKD